MRIRLGRRLSLIFFVCLLVVSCRQKDEEITIIWKDKQAIGIAIPGKLIEQAPDPVNDIRTRLKGNADAMLGNYKNVDGRIIFTTLIPLSPGAAYEVLFKNRLIGTVKIPAADASKAAYILNIFPSVDTVPVNLLKIYVQFSAPMREGEALQHIHLVDEKNDTLPDVFLDLQPELWDSARKVLTVWLDPGRIKRDLIPNRQMGNPLQPGQQYKIVISNNWKDAQGLGLRQSFSKQFVAGGRDSISPQPQQWKLELPAANTVDGLGIRFGESLDYFLLEETITIINENGNTISGKSGPLSNGTGYAFWPDNSWRPGGYKLRISTVLEDLAGNNLSRVFDRDIRLRATTPDGSFIEKSFTIR